MSDAVKSSEAYRTIGEVAEEIGVPQHVLRFWETKFAMIRPLKRGGNRRYYRPEDVLLLRAINVLLYNEGYTIRGVQKLLREQGPRQVIGRVVNTSLSEDALASESAEPAEFGEGAAEAMPSATERAHPPLGPAVPAAGASALEDAAPEPGRAPAFDALVGADAVQAPAHADAGGVPEARAEGLFGSGSRDDRQAGAPAVSAGTASASRNESSATDAELVELLAVLRQVRHELALAVTAAR